MLDIEICEPGSIRLVGRFDAAHSDAARETFQKITGDCTVSFADLDYIASIGLSILLETQKRLSRSGHRLYLVEMPPRIKNVFLIAGFDAVFDIE